jgi:uncharacterized protein
MDYHNKERPFYTVNDFYASRFGGKVFKVSLNGNFTCPNRDGTISTLGCIYCSESGSGDFAGDPQKALKEQYADISAKMRLKWPHGKPLIYFQANTNTYAPQSVLQQLFQNALALDPEIVGIAIATRPDCLADDTVQYLADLAKTTFVAIELGLQTIHDHTAKWLNRGHDRACFDAAVRKFEGTNVHVVAHIINSLPGESEEMMLETIRHLNTLPIHGIKIHMLHVMKQTPLAKRFEEHPFELLTIEQYAWVVANQIELLRPDIVVYRVTGDAPKDQLIAPLWTLHKFVVQNEIDKLLRFRNSCQGSRYRP